MTPAPIRTSLSRQLATGAALLAIGLAATSCESGPHRGEMGRGGPHRVSAVPTMTTGSMFFDGKIEAEVRLGRGPMPLRKKAGDDTPPRADDLGFTNAIDVSGDSRPHAGGPDGPSPGGFGGGRPGMGGPGVREEHHPAVQLRLRLTNHSPAAVTVEVTNFNSMLGNFVVTPAQLTIEPGQSVEADPMNSRLGVPEGEIPLKLRLRSDGKSEEQTVTLKVAN